MALAEALVLSFLLKPDSVKKPISPACLESTHYHFDDRTVAVVDRQKFKKDPDAKDPSKIGALLTKIACDRTARKLCSPIASVEDTFTALRGGSDTEPPNEVFMILRRGEHVLVGFAPLPKRPGSCAKPQKDPVAEAAAKSLSELVHSAK